MTISKKDLVILFCNYKLTVFFLFFAYEQAQRKKTDKKIHNGEKV